VAMGEGPMRVRGIRTEVTADWGVAKDLRAKFVRFDRLLGGAEFAAEYERTPRGQGEMLPRQIVLAEPGSYK